jgi:hypothetical protein
MRFAASIGGRLRNGSACFGANVPATGAIYGLAPAARRRSRPVRAWNLFRSLRAVRRSTVDLNGQEISSLQKAEPQEQENERRELENGDSPRQRGPHDYLYILRSCAGRRAISRREALFAMPEGKMDPCGRRGAAKNPYSITLLAWASNIDGNSMPRALAVFRLTARSNFTGARTGRSAGFAPLRIRST